jgi:hypothetical protein
LLSFRGIDTPSLAAQGEQRRLSLFNIRRDNSPDAYGDLVLAINPPEPAKPPIFKRLARSHTEAGGLPSPTQASTGDNLELAELDADLVVTLANGRYLLKSERGGGGDLRNTNDAARRHGRAHHQRSGIEEFGADC